MRLGYTMTTLRLNTKACSSPSPRKFKVQASAAKIMCTVFWDAEDVLLIGYMPHMVTVTGVYYTDLLHKLLVAIKQKHRGKLTKVPLVLHDNASAHRSHIGQSTLLECGFEEMCHPPYSPYLAASDYHLYPNWKKHLRGQIFERWGAQVCDRQVVNRTVRTVLFYRHLETPVSI